MKLESKVALVVGGSSGIGDAIARSFAAEGCRVVIIGRSEDTLRKALEAPEYGDRGCHRVCDATDREAIEQAIEWCEAEVGPLDFLVNSAGTNVSGRSFADIDPDDFQKVLDANLNATFLAMRSVLKSMRARGTGTIINVVSLGGLRSIPLAGVPYTASKFAQGSLGLIANQEANEDGVRVTNIYPGETNTPIVDRRPTPPPPERRAAMLQPDDVAAMALTVALLPPRAVVPEIVITPRHMPLN
ncbi:SDR family oxidoreductase [Stratiformator vulcanicus]|uniref:Putative oxidoreductase n=1 Tax=Stratiformator vulcanicus TaxID=2527980 RepID=A0A517QWM2_9PLAN|nr:SDR family oxidoreductase [Stratiformator vulcanicus]QDT36066.1 putative oxidoreductase [Stratiformator vulcanicus]